MIIFLIFVEFLNHLNCDDFICDEPNQVYHDSDNKANNVCSDGCETGCYCKRGYKMNNDFECIPGDPKGKKGSWKSVSI